MASRDAFLARHFARIDGQDTPSSAAKHKKMTASPFVFYRGSSQLFYADLQQQRIKLPKSLLKLPLTTIMGDCHTSNFGFFTEESSHSESVIFSLNDFDDACIGHAIWDILRFLVSLGLAADHCVGNAENKYHCIEDKYLHKPVVTAGQAMAAMHIFLEGYIETLKALAVANGDSSALLDQNYFESNKSSILKKRYAKAQSAAVGGNLFWQKSSLAKAADLTELPLRFRHNPDKFTRDGLDKKAVKAHFAPYFYDTIHDVVFRLNSGTGSVNLQRMYLLVGPVEISTSANILKRFHVVEVKQQRLAAPLYFFPDLHHQNALNPAHLTVKCQRTMQRRPDLFLDESHFDNAHWLLRSRHHAKVGIDPEHICFGKKNTQQNGFENYAYACAIELALAHCRGDMGSNEFESRSAKEINASISALVDLSLDYIEQVKHDWRWLGRAIGKT